MDSFHHTPPEDDRRADLPAPPIVNHCINSLVQGIVGFSHLGVSASSCVIQQITTQVALHRTSAHNLLATAIRTHLDGDAETLDGSYHSQPEPQVGSSQESQKRAAPGTRTGPNRALGYKVKHASGFIRTYKWDKMTELFFDAEIRMNEYWPNAKVNWQGKLNIQQHIARVSDYDNSVIKSMIDLLDEKDQR